MGQVFYLPARRPLPAEESAALDAATEWLLSELAGPASIDALRALAERELARSRDAIHRRWARTFLDHLEQHYDR